MLTLRSDQIAIKDRYSSRGQRAWNFLIKNGPLEVWRLIKIHGPKGSLGFVIRNVRYLVAVYVNRHFDRKFSVDTSGDIPAHHLEVEGNNREYGAAFLSTPAKTFNRILGLMPADVSDFVFIDIGSGKGRALLQASARNFKRIIGVEYARELVECARRNFETYRNPAQACRDLSCVLTDATTFDLPQENCILYFLRPFEDNITAQILENVKRSYQAKPRKILLVFLSPREPEYPIPHSLLLSSGFLRLKQRSALPFDWGAVKPFEVALYGSYPV